MWVKQFHRKDCTEFLQTYVSQQIGKIHMVMYDWTGFVRLGFGSRDGTGGDVCSSGRSCYKLPPCSAEPIPGDSKIEAPLAKVWGHEWLWQYLGDSTFKKGSV